MQHRLPAVAVVAATLLVANAAHADEPRGLLETLHRHVTLTSTVTDNGDLNPYAIVVAPVSAGKIQKDDVLVDNFNNISNLQGTGGTIVDYRPATKKTALFAVLPQHLPQCPGGVGMTTAMTMLKTGWVIVGSAPSKDGTTRTRGDGCLLVFDARGQFVTAWTGPHINDPWGNIATVDNGARATLFISMSGFDVPGPEVKDPATGVPVTVNKAIVLRLALTIPEGKPPEVVSQTVIADGFGQRADRDAFLIGPMDAVVWVGDEGPAWMRGGSYVVVRRARIFLEHWDRMKVAFQEQTVGRHKASGAPLGKSDEHEQPDLDAADADGNPLTPENSHARLAMAQTNDGARIPRRAYSYNDGVAMTAERWPPWQQGMEFDAGLLFMCHQRDPRTGFIKIFERMAKFDMMNQFVTNTGSALFACPRGIASGEFVGQPLFST